jgi:hypothetical protein
VRPASRRPCQMANGRRGYMRSAPTTGPFLAPACSAGWQPAVSPTGSRLCARQVERPQIANLRHSTARQGRNQTFGLRRQSKAATALSHEAMRFRWTSPSRAHQSGVGKWNNIFDGSLCEQSDLQIGTTVVDGPLREQPQSKGFARPATIPGDTDRLPVCATSMAPTRTSPGIV